MAKDETRGFRLVKPRKWALVAATGLAAAQAVPDMGVIAVAPAFAAGDSSEAGEAGESGTVVQPAAAGEAGEAGENGVARSEGPAEFLTELGLFEATYRVAAALYAQGEVALAQEHLENAHHADYDDLEDDLAKYGAPPFEKEASSLAEAVRSGADAATVARRLADLLAAMDAARAAAGISPRERVLSIKELVATAAADFEGGVEDGTVTSPQEYRDAWGFVATARARAEALAAAENPELAKAGRAVLEQLDKVKPLLPSLTATRVAGDPSVLYGAAGWIEIISLQLK